MDRRQKPGYSATEASSDVAALVSGLARSIDIRIPGVAAKTIQRVRAAQRPGELAAQLTDALVEDLVDWPENLWLVIDDYQFLMRSRAAEDVVHLLSERDKVNLLVTSRERPIWATPRRRLYGEVYELSRAALALTAQEATQVVGSESRTDLPGLMALTEGWPAVIGLAALAHEIPVRGDERLPTSLYQYFADELFKAADPRTQRGLCTLCLLPTLRGSDIDSLLGNDAEHVTCRGERLGFLAKDRDRGFELHPLLRTFLREKVELGPDRGSAARDRVVSFLLGAGRWDDAFALIIDYNLSAHLSVLIERGLYSLLDAGRVATVERWTGAARTMGKPSPAVDPMEAEVLFRAGNWHGAERLARSAATRFATGAPLRARAFYRAGHSAQLSDNHRRALEHHRAAWKNALSQHEASEALWGMFITQCELEKMDEAKLTLEELKRISTGHTEDELRILGSSMVLARRAGGLQHAVCSPSTIKHSISRHADPVVKSGFLQTLATGLNLVARYQEALDVATREIEEARISGLAFVLPHAFCNAAVAHLGLRNTKNASTLVKAAEAAAADRADMHASLNARAIHARLLLSQGRPRDAADVIPLSAWTHLPTPGMGGDYLATRALALACSDDFIGAQAQAEEAREFSCNAEARVLGAFAIAIVAVKEGHNVESATTAALEEVSVTGNRDSMICAYRAHPPLLPALIQIQDHRAELRDLIRSVGDGSFAKRQGVEVDDKADTLLTPRELQVLELLKTGMTNQEIARQLFISKTTVKVHMRSIFAKLGVHTRTEAALAAVTRAS